MVQYAIPKRVGLDDIKDILKAYYVEGAHSEPVSTKEVEDTAQLPSRVGRQTQFLEELGVLEKSGKQRMLTDAGEEIAEALMGGGEEQAKARMRELLADWDFSSKVQGFVQMQGPVKESQLLEYISANADSDDKRGKQTLIEIFLWANLLNEEEDGVYTAGSSKPSKPEKERAEVESQRSTESVEAETTKVPETVPQEDYQVSRGESQINIEFKFGADDEPDKIEKVVKAARKGLGEEIAEAEDSTSN